MCPEKRIKIFQPSGFTECLPVVQSIFQSKLLHRNQGMTAQCLGDLVPDLWGQAGDVADGAGTGAFGSAERLTNQIRNIFLLSVT